MTQRRAHKLTHTRTQSPCACCERTRPLTKTHRRLSLAHSLTLSFRDSISLRVKRFKFCQLSHNSPSLTRQSTQSLALQKTPSSHSRFTPTSLPHHLWPLIVEVWIVPGIVVRGHSPPPTYGGTIHPRPRRASVPDHENVFGRFVTSSTALSRPQLLAIFSPGPT